MGAPVFAVSEAQAALMTGVLSCFTVAPDTALADDAASVSDVVPPPLEIVVESH